MKWLFVLVALVAGAAMPVQAGINLRLRQALGDPVVAALATFAIGTAGLAAYCLALRPVPTAAMVADAPWWAWTGGLFGAFFVYVTIVLAANLGAATSMAWLVAGQFMAALVLDHYGLVAYQVHAVSLPRLLGVVLLVAGAVLVNKY